VEEEVVRHRLVRVVLTVTMLLGGALAASVLAQGLTGQITGTVTDSGGGVMPGATVSIKNAGTNQVRESVTGADGAFTFPDLLAGTYDITVSVQGFKTYEQKRRSSRPPTQRGRRWSTAIRSKTSRSRGGTSPAI
jgi:hypothetical protein